MATFGMTFGAEFDESGFLAGNTVCKFPNNDNFRALLDVVQEHDLAVTKWPVFNSAHEGYAVLLEEVDELRACVWTRQDRRDLKKMRKEAVQVAAMAFRFIIEVCDEERGRK